MPVDVITAGLQGPAGPASLSAGAIITTEGDVIHGGSGGTAARSKATAWDVLWTSGVTAYPDGTAYAAMADSSTGIIAAIAKAASLNIPVVGRGTFRVDATITIASDCDFAGATFICSNTGLTLIRAGTSTASAVVRRKRMILPKVQNAVKVSTGWTGASIGIELANLHECQVEVPYVQSFTDGLRLATYGTMGTAYNNIFLGHLDNNKRNIVLAPGASTGWTNSNQFFGGRCSHDSAEGAAASGTRHVLLIGGSAIQPNGNRWFGTSLESPLTPTSVTEYVIESIAGIYNRFYDCRYEVTAGASPKIYWNEFSASYFSRDNTIFEGYNAAGIAFTKSTNSARNRLFSETKNVAYGASSTVAAQRYGNTTSDAGPQIEGVDLSVDPLTAAVGDWRWRDTANARAVKAKADTVARHSLATATGNQTWSDGSAAADTVLYRVGANQLRTDDTFIAADGVTTKVKAGTPVDGDFATAPPSGTIVVDTTASKIWVRVGSTWKSVTVA